MELLQRVFTPSKSLIVTKNTNFKSIKNVKSIIGTYPNVKIILTNDSYLIGYPKYLCEYLNINENDTLILKTSEIYNIYNAVIKHKSILNNIITISGDNIQKSLVINTKLGVPLTELIDEFITILDNDYEVFLNGYLKGIKVKKIEDIVITNEIDSIIINKKHTLENTECINCGACQKICPFKINIKKCYFKNLNHKLCIGCGLCNFVCPANIDLRKVVRRDSVEEENN